MAITPVGVRVMRGIGGFFAGFLVAAAVDLAMGDAYGGAVVTDAIVVAGVAVSQLFPVRPKAPAGSMAAPGPPMRRRPRPSDADARLWITPPSHPSPAPGWPPDRAP